MRWIFQVRQTFSMLPQWEHMPFAKRITEDSVYVALADTGSGIRAEDLAKLFQPYHTTKVSGHGLGLMIVQRILRDHGGHVGIESKEGVGTVVTLQFPQKYRRVKMLAGG